MANSRQAGTAYSERSFVADISPRHLQLLTAVGTRNNYPAGTVIHLAGDNSAALSIIDSGAVKICRSNARGEEEVTTVLQQGDSFGELPLFTGVPRTHTAIAVQDATLINIPKPHFFRLLDEHPDLRDEFLRSLAFKLIEALDMLSDEHSLSAPAKVAKYLWQQATLSETNTIAMRQVDIAARLNVSRLSVSQLIKDLIKKDVAVQGYGSIRIVDRDKLQEWFAS